MNVPLIETIVRASELLEEYAEVEENSAANDLPRRQQRARDYAAEIRGVARRLVVHEPPAERFKDVPDGWQEAMYEAGRDPAPQPPAEPAAHRETSEEQIKVGAHVLSEWLDDNAPLYEHRYLAPAKAAYEAMRAVAAHSAAQESEPNSEIMETWRALVDEAEWVIDPRRGKCVILTEEMCIRLGATIEGIPSSAPAPPAVTNTQAVELPKLVGRYAGNYHPDSVVTDIDNANRYADARVRAALAAQPSGDAVASDGYDAWANPQREAELLHAAIMDAVQALMDGKCEFDIVAPLRKALAESADRVIAAAPSTATKAADAGEGS